MLISCIRGQREEWKDCVRFIIDAKRRVLNFLDALCDDQRVANQLCRPLHVHIHHHHNGKNVTDLNSTIEIEQPERRERSPICYKAMGQYRYRQRLKKESLNGNTNTSGLGALQQQQQRGVVYTGSIHHFKKIFQSVTALRMTNCSLPVEVWVNTVALIACRRTLETMLPGTRCRQLSDSIQGWASKFYALLYTNLDDALFIDADNVPVRDVNEIFSSQAYRETGAVLWPDLWGFNCSKGRAITVPGAVSL